MKNAQKMYATMAIRKTKKFLKLSEIKFFPAQNSFLAGRNSSLQKNVFNRLL
jgi:hypothetical protein